MRRKPKFSKEVKIDACERYSNGHGSFESVAKEVDCSPEQFRQWYLKYQIHGASEFETKSTN
ncbi:hypothetical protein SANA_03610 [Gottschalkiaceae bacterium SANA]|nr:hypothetical protein SANA_03610 [Gottschalkiaceae bacterium SANA]